MLLLGKGNRYFYHLVLLLFVYHDFSPIALFQFQLVQKLIKYVVLSPKLFVSIKHQMNGLILSTDKQDIEKILAIWRMMQETIMVHMDYLVDGFFIIHNLSDDK